MGRIFTIQLIVIGLATLIGIYITQLIVEDLLTRQALNGEAEHYWDLLAQDQKQPLPNTANMTGFMVESTAGSERGLANGSVVRSALGDGKLPAEFAELPVGSLAFCRCRSCCC